MSDRLREEWNLPDEFQIIETRSKEVGIVLNELEELAWRSAGEFTQQEIDTIQKMFSINRNKDHFDRQFYENDMQSMRDFIKKVNKYDDRNDLLKEWLARKEEEIKSRVVVPPKSLQQTDEVLYK